MAQTIQCINNHGEAASLLLTNLENGEVAGLCLGCAPTFLIATGESLATTMAEAQGEDDQGEQPAGSAAPVESPPDGDGDGAAVTPPPDTVPTNEGDGGRPQPAQEPVATSAGSDDPAAPAAAE